MEGGLHCVCKDRQLHRLVHPVSRTAFLLEDTAPELIHFGLLTLTNILHGLIEVIVPISVTRRISRTQLRERCFLIEERPGQLIGHPRSQRLGQLVHAR